jgi:hypothetical protein
MEAGMPFSLVSYLLGVATVVGVLAFGFGGGVLLTHTVMKESPAARTRVERMARAEPDGATAARVSPDQAFKVEAPSTTRNTAPDEAGATRQATAPDRDHSTAAVAIDQDAASAPPAAMSPLPDHAQAGTPVPDAAREPEPDAPSQAARAPRMMQQAAREPQPPNEVERTETRPVASRNAGRRVEHSKRYADRGQFIIKQRRIDSGEEAAQDVHQDAEQGVSRPPDPAPHHQPFGGFFGRPADGSD